MVFKGQVGSPEIQVMIIFYIFGYLILVGFFLVEKFLRKGSKDMGKTNFDQNSTKYISIVMGLSFILLFLTPLLNFYLIGKISCIWFGITGLLLGTTGIIIRCAAFSTLGRFFTRTLQKTDRHVLITNGIYQYIRHPGYLSDILIFLGVAMALYNWIPVIFVILAYPAVYTYRIKKEEKMLVEIFGEAYIFYQKHTRMVLPFLF
jgi:protein-S-isoprenylcysteine O-methyltransferase Ste14